MAIERDSLTTSIQIETNAPDANKELTRVEKQLEKLNKVIEASAKEFEKLNIAMGQNLAQQTKTLDGDFNNLAKTEKVFGKQTTGLTKNVKELTGALGFLDLVLLRITGSIGSLNDLISIIDRFTDPAGLARLIGLATILSDITGNEGLPLVSKLFDRAGGSLKDLTRLALDFRKRFRLDELFSESELQSIGLAEALQTGLLQSLSVIDNFEEGVAAGVVTLRAFGEAIKSVKVLVTTLTVTIATLAGLRGSLQALLNSFKGFFKASSVGAAQLNGLSRAIIAVGEAVGLPQKTISTLILEIDRLVYETSRVVAGTKNIVKGFKDVEKSGVKAFLGVNTLLDEIATRVFKALSPDSGAFKELDTFFKSAAEIISDFNIAVSRPISDSFFASLGALTKKELPDFSKEYIDLVNKISDNPLFSTLSLKDQNSLFRSITEGFDQIFEEAELTHRIKLKVGVDIDAPEEVIRTISRQGNKFVMEIQREIVRIFNNLEDTASAVNFLLPLEEQLKQTRKIARIDAFEDLNKLIAETLKKSKNQLTKEVVGLSKTLLDFSKKSENFDRIVASLKRMGESSTAGAAQINRLSKAILLIGDALGVPPAAIATITLEIDRLVVETSRLSFVLRKDVANAFRGLERIGVQAFAGILLAINLGLSNLVAVFLPQIITLGAIFVQTGKTMTTALDKGPLVAAKNLNQEIRSLVKNIRTGKIGDQILAGVAGISDEPTKSLMGFARQIDLTDGRVKNLVITMESLVDRSAKGFKQITKGVLTFNRAIGVVLANVELANRAIQLLPLDFVPKLVATALVELAGDFVIWSRSAKALQKVLNDMNPLKVLALGQALDSVVGLLTAIGKSFVDLGRSIPTRVFKTMGNDLKAGLAGVAKKELPDLVTEYKRLAKLLNDNPLQIKISADMQEKFAKNIQRGLKQILKLGDAARGISIVTTVDFVPESGRNFINSGVFLTKLDAELQNLKRIVATEAERVLSKPKPIRILFGIKAATLDVLDEFNTRLLRIANNSGLLTGVMLKLSRVMRGLESLLLRMVNSLKDIPTSLVVGAKQLAIFNRGILKIGEALGVPPKLMAAISLEVDNLIFTLSKLMEPLKLVAKFALSSLRSILVGAEFFGAQLLSIIVPDLVNLGIAFEKTFRKAAEIFRDRGLPKSFRQFGKEANILAKEFATGVAPSLNLVAKEGHNLNRAFADVSDVFNIEDLTKYEAQLNKTKRAINFLLKPITGLRDATTGLNKSIALQTRQFQSLNETMESIFKSGRKIFEPLALGLDLFNQTILKSGIVLAAWAALLSQITIIPFFVKAVFFSLQLGEAFKLLTIQQGALALAFKQIGATVSVAAGEFTKLGMILDGLSGGKIASIFQSAANSLNTFTVAISNSFSKINQTITTFRTGMAGAIPPDTLTKFNALRLSIDGLGNTFVVTFNKSIIPLSNFTKRFAASALEVAQGAGRVSRDVIKIPLALATVKASPLFNLVEALSFASGAFLILGNVLRATESKMLQFIGTTSLLLAKIADELLFGLKKVLTTLGELGQRIGTNIINAFVKFTEISEKAAGAQNQFEFAVRSFGEAIGVRFVGSLDDWNKKIDEIRSRSVFMRQDITASVALLVKESQILGLSAKEAQKILSRSAEIAAANGTTIKSVTDAVISGLTGQSQALLGLGVDLRESSVAHGDLAKSIKGLGEQERIAILQEARLQSLFKQTNPLIGSAALQYDSLTGQLQRYDRALDTIKAKLGEASFLQVAFTKILAQALEVIGKLPDGILQFVGTLALLGSTLAIVGGTILKYGILLSSLSVAMAFLSTVMATNVTVQNLMTAGFTRLGAALGVQTVAVTGATAAWSNLLLVMQAGLVRSLPLMVATLGSITSVIKAAFVAMGRFTLSLLANPLFWKAAIIVGGIALVAKALEELSAVGKTLDAILESLKTAIFGVQDAFDGLDTSKTKQEIGILAATFKFLLDNVKLAISGITQGLGLLTLGIVEAIRAAKSLTGSTDAELASLDKTIHNLETSIGLASQESTNILAEYGVMDEILTAQVVIHDKIAKKTAETGTNVAKTIEVAQTLNERLTQIQNDIRGIGTNQVQQIELQRDIELEKIAALEEQLKKNRLLFKFQDKINKIKTLEGEKAALTIADMRLKTTEQLVEMNQRVAGELTLIGLEGEELAKAKLDLELAAIDAQEKKLAKEGLLTKEGQKQIQIAKNLATERAKGVDETGFDEMFAAGMDAAIGIAGGIFDIGAEAFAAVTDAAGPSMALALSQETDNLILGLQNSAENMSGMLLASIEQFDAVVNAMPKILQKFFAKLPEIIDKMFDSIVNLLDKLPAMVAAIMEKLPEIIAKILERLPEVIEKFFEVLPQIIALIVAKIPEIFSTLMEKLPEIIAALVEGLVGAMGEIVAALVDTFITKGGLVKMAIAYVKAVARVWPLVTKAFIDGLKRGLKAIFKGFEFKLPPLELPDLTPLEKAVDNIFRKVVTGATGVTEDIFAAIDIPTDPFGTGAEKTKGEIEKVVDFVEVAISNAGTEIKGLWDTFLAALKEVWLFIWEFFLLGPQITKAFLWVWNEVILPIAALVQKAFLWAWENVIMPIVTIVQRAFQWVLDNVINPIFNIVKRAFQWVQEKIINPFIDGVRSVFNWLHKHITKPFTDGVRAAFDWVHNHITHPLVSGLESVFNFVKPVFESFGRIVDKFFDAVKKLGGGGGGPSLNKILGKAKGGIIPGRAKVPGDSFMNDVIPIMASPGEFIVPREIVDKPGVMEILDALLHGADVEFKALGGSLQKTMDVINRNPMEETARPGQFGFQRTTQTEQQTRTTKPTTITKTQNITINFDSGSIVFTDITNPEEFVDRMLAEIKQKSVDGEFVISSSGIRETA